MALTDDNGSMVMPVQPMGNGYGGYGYPVPYAMPYGNGGGLFGNGGDSWLGILFLIALCNGGFGFGGFGGGWGMMNGMWGMDGAFPWILASNANNQNATNAGFDNLAVGNALSGIQSAVTNGFSDTQLGIAGINQNICQTGAGITSAINQGFANTNLGMCQGFNGVNNSIFGAQTAIAQQLNTNELASLNRSFAEQTANTQGFNNVQAQLAQCCCDNRLATESLRATVLSENCQDRYEASNNTRDIIQSQTSGTQAILDKLCALELDAKNDKIADLERQLTMANLAASQVEQTAQLRASQATTANQLVSELRSCPIPAQPVYGNQPIFTCPNNNSGCGCGCGGFAN